MKKLLIALIPFFFYFSMPTIAHSVCWTNTPTTSLYPDRLSSDYGPRNPSEPKASKFHKGLDFPDDKNVKAVE